MVAVKDELAGVAVAKVCCRRTEATILLRLAATVHRVDGQVVVGADLDHGPTAQRLGLTIAEVFGRHREVSVHAVTDEGRCPRRWRVRVQVDGHGLADRVGLLECGGRPVRVLDQRLSYGPLCDAAAAWRGALLAGGTLSAPGQPPALQVAHPGTQIAVAPALVAAARRLEATATTRTTRGTEQVVITDPDAITALLTRLGAPASALAWRPHAQRVANRPETPHVFE